MKRWLVRIGIGVLGVGGTVLLLQKSPKAKGLARTTLCTIGGFDAKSDLERLCGAFECANQARGGRAIAALEPEVRDRVFKCLSDVRGQLCSPDVVNALAAFGAATPDTRCKFVKDAAAAKGFSNWTCEAMDALSENWK